MGPPVGWREGICQKFEEQEDLAQIKQNLYHYFTTNQNRTSILPFEMKIYNGIN